jgi:hypothetical protein
LANARSEAAVARSELAEQLAGRYQAEAEGAQAKADAEITRAQVRAKGAQDLAENRASQISGLIAQVEDLRADHVGLAGAPKGKPRNPDRGVKRAGHEVSHFRGARLARPRKWPGLGQPGGRR